MANLSVLYITDNHLNEAVRDLSLRYLYKAVGDLPLISVSHKPMDVGTNICVGEQERSGLTMYRQIKRGLEAIDTEFVAIAEHDCLYTDEHFSFRPPDHEHYWYNLNNYLVQWPGSNPDKPQYDGMYSILPGRRVQSQLVCAVEPFRQVVEDQIAIVEDPRWNTLRYNRPVGEPGTVDVKRLRLKTRGWNSLLAKMKDFMINYNARDFKTTIPNIDIRHGSNFTGHRRGKHRTYNLEPWGEFKSLMVQ